MPELVTLSSDGPLGKAGVQVWVDDASQVVTPDGWVDPNAKPSKKAAAVQDTAPSPPDMPPAAPSPPA